MNGMARQDSAAAAAIKTIRNDYRWAIFAFCTGLLAHLAKFANYYPNWDGMAGMKRGVLDMLGLGRWFSGLSTVLMSSPYDLNWMQGVLSAAFLSITIVFILDLCGINSMHYRVLAIVLFMVFPSMASTFCYMPWAPAYMLGFLLAILALYASVKGAHNKDVIFASLLVCFSLGIYQIYVTAAAVCFLYVLIFKILENAETGGGYAGKICIRFIVSFISGGILYLVINTALLMITGMAMTDYQGISSVGNMSLLDLLYAFVRMVTYAGAFFIATFKITFYGIVNVVFLALAVFVWIKYVLLDRKRSGIQRILISGCLCLSVPATYIFLFVSAGTEYHMLMQAGNYFHYLGVIMLLGHGARISRGIKSFFIGLIWVLCFYHFINNNVAYKQTELSWQRTVFETTELLSWIDEINTGGYTEVALVGEFENYEPLNTVPLITGASCSNFLGRPTSYFVKFSGCYFGRRFTAAPDKKIEEIKNTGEFHGLDAYPRRGCIKVVGGIIVVNLGDG